MEPPRQPPALPAGVEGYAAPYRVRLERMDTSARAAAYFALVDVLRSAWRGRRLRPRGFKPQNLSFWHTLTAFWHLCMSFLPGQPWGS